MTLKQLEKKYPKAYKQFVDKNYGYEWLNRKLVLNEEDDVRSHWKEITEYGDWFGLYLSSDFFVMGVKWIWVIKEGANEICKYDFTERWYAETKGIDNLFKLLETRLK